MFLSSTSEMRKYPAPRSFLAAAEAAIIRAGDVVNGLEFFSASEEAPADVCRREVSRSDIYVGLFGFRYGPMVPGGSSSYQELEYRTALEAGIPLLLFMLGDDAVVPVTFVDSDLESLQRQRAFRQRLRQSSVKGDFSTPEQLESQVMQSLVRLRDPAPRPDRRTVMILCDDQTQNLGMLLARELAPESGVDVQLLGLSSSPDGGGVERLLTRLADVDLALILPSDNELASEWFEIGAVAGALGAERTMLVVPEGPSGLGMQTKLPVLRLRLTGNQVAEARFAAAEALTRLLAMDQRSQARPGFYSCFLSYVAEDADFVARLYADLQDAGIPCWFDRADIRPGEFWRQDLTRAIAGQDKVLVVLSRNSLRSRWVEREIARAAQLEDDRNRAILFPIRLDDAVFDEESGWARELAQQRQIGDFTRWRDEASYRSALRRLVRNLTISVASDTAEAEL